MIQKRTSYPTGSSSTTGTHYPGSTRTRTRTGADPGRNWTRTTYGTRKPTRTRSRNWTTDRTRSNWRSPYRTARIIWLWNFALRVGFYAIRILPYCQCPAHARWFFQHIDYWADSSTFSRWTELQVRNSAVKFPEIPKRPDLIFNWVQWDYKQLNLWFGR